MDTMSKWEKDVREFLENNKNELVKFDHENKILIFRTKDFGKRIYRVSFEKLNEKMNKYFYNI